MAKRIYLKDWLSLKPYKKQTITDSYYLDLCNEVKRVILTNKQSFVLQRYLDAEEIVTLSCFLTSYFEDLISETNIWNSFVQSHKRLYNKTLPFYVLNDDYYEEEINLQDICFLIWYFLNTVQEEKFISPFNEFIVEAANKVMDIFGEAWEYAPENEYLKSFYEVDENEDDYYVARNLIDKILFQSYLFYPDTLLDLLEQDTVIIEQNKDDENIMMFLNENRDSTLNNAHTRLLSLKGKEWASNILGENHPVSKSYLKISPRITGFFLYKGQDDKNIFIEHIASSKKFELAKISFDHSDTLKEVDTILFLGIVLWKNEWWFSGVYFQQPFNANLVLDEKNSLSSRRAVDFLDHQTEKTEDALIKQLKIFEDYNDGLQIAFMPSDKIKNFINNYLEYFNNS